MSAVLDARRKLILPNSYVRDPTGSMFEGERRVLFVRDRLVYLRSDLGGWLITVGAHLEVV